MRENQAPSEAPKRPYHSQGWRGKERKIRTPLILTAKPCLFRKEEMDLTWWTGKEEHSRLTDTMGEKSRQVQETQKVWGGCSRGAREKKRWEEEVCRGQTAEDIL